MTPKIKIDRLIHIALRGVKPPQGGLWMRRRLLFDYAVMPTETISPAAKFAASPLRHHLLGKEALLRIRVI